MLISAVPIAIRIATAAQPEFAPESEAATAARIAATIVPTTAARIPNMSSREKPGT